MDDELREFNEMTADELRDYEGVVYRVSGWGVRQKDGTRRYHDGEYRDPANAAARWGRCTVKCYKMRGEIICRRVD